MVKGKTETSLTISREARNALKKMADEEGKSMSSFVDSLILEKYYIYKLFGTALSKIKISEGNSFSKHLPSLPKGEECIEESSIERLRFFAGSLDEEVLQDAKEDPEHEKVLWKICGLRDEGFTFEKIAQGLNEEGIPTFSGKGKWHRQTIHKLFRKYSETIKNGVPDIPLELDVMAGFESLIKIHTERAEWLDHLRKAFLENDGDGVVKYLKLYIGVS